MEANGTCLQDTYNYLYYKPDKYNWRIIHAMVERPSDGLRHPHAVVFNTENKCIYEVSNSFKKNIIVMPYLIWSQRGKVSNVKNYKMEDLNNKLLETRTWDFYHLVEQGIISHP